jgi:glutathione synthase/RimK-type ligase-like ATP-grasp enzyme
MQAWGLATPSAARIMAEECNLGAAMATLNTKLCILTPDASYSERWQGDAAQYRALLGERLTFRSWVDAGDLSKFDCVLPLLVWGYPEQSARWYCALDAWEEQGIKFINPIPTLRWNTDKDYLIDLAAVGIPTVPTVEIHGLTPATLAQARAELGTKLVVVKPSISAGAMRTYRLSPEDAIPFDVYDKEMLVQPLMPSVTQEGEYSLLWFGGHYSHAILKKPANGDFRVQPQFGGLETGVEPPADAVILAEATLAACPFPVSYARVDMLRDTHGNFTLMELELIEPALFLHHAADKGAAFAASIRRTA